MRVAVGVAFGFIYQSPAGQLIQNNFFGIFKEYAAQMLWNTFFVDIFTFMVQAGDLGQAAFLGRQKVLFTVHYRAVDQAGPVFYRDKVLYIYAMRFSVVRNYTGIWRFVLQT